LGWDWFCNLEICEGIEVVVVDDDDGDEEDNDEEVRDDVVDDDDDDDEVGGFFLLVGLGLMVFFGCLVLVLPMSLSL
jgi:hypothetical protein